VTALVIALVVLSVLLIAFAGFFISKSRSRPSAPAMTPERTAPPSPAVHAPSAAPERATEAPVVEEAPPAEVPSGPPDYRERLGRSRGLFASLRARVGRGAIDADVLEDLETSLLGADVGVATTDHLLEVVRQRSRDRELDDIDGLLGAVRVELLSILEVAPDGGAVDRSLNATATTGRVPVWLFVGVNGVGKTTTIGKLATREVAAGKRVLLAAGDTFRAAAADQLSMWADRSGAEIVRGAEGGDPSAVVFDAIERAGARKADLVLADTAGRLHTKVNLIEELKKVRRVADRDPGEVTEVLLVLDATTGQNAVSQARQFLEAVDATGVVLTKLDGTARGGVVVAIQRELGLPVKLIGLGEGANDLVAFDPVAFIDALLEP